MPASSQASHTNSRSRRCWGSTCAASRGEMPKNCASKRSTRSRNPPQREYVRPGFFGSGSNRSRNPGRLAGASVTALNPSFSKPQNACGSFAPPGNRHPIPTIAISRSRSRAAPFSNCDCMATRSLDYRLRAFVGAAWQIPQAARGVILPLTPQCDPLPQIRSGCIRSVSGMIRTAQFTCQGAEQEGGTPSRARQVGMDSGRLVAPASPNLGEDASQSAIFSEEYR